MRNSLILGILGLFSLSCGTSSKSTDQVDNSTKTVSQTAPLRYEIYLLASRTTIHPPDEITIDTNGQMVAISQQLMNDGKWKNPKGLAMLEEVDKVILDSIIADERLYTINAEDILPPCADGADYTILVARRDKPMKISLKTNSCAATENTLSGGQRTAFKKLLQLIDTVRVKYRPLFRN